VFRVSMVFLVCQTRLKLSVKVDECQPLPGGWYTRLTWRFSGFLCSASLFFNRRTFVREGMPVVTASSQGLTLVHVRAQFEHLLDTFMT